MICAARPTNKARVAKVSVPQGRISARSVKAQYTVTLETPTGVQEIECSGKEYMLDVAEAKGLQLPYSCRAGACYSCAAKITAGTVDESYQTFLNETERSNGVILTCVALPTSDCTIVTHQEENMY